MINMGGGQWSTMPIPRFFTKTSETVYSLSRCVGVPILAVVTLLGITATPVQADIPSNSSVISIEGHGWGHGVGMSQYGAYSRALSVEEGGGGQTAEQILSFYYPGRPLSVVEALNDISVTSLVRGLHSQLLDQQILLTHLAMYSQISQQQQF